MEYMADLNELLDIFENYLTAEDILFANFSSRISVILTKYQIEHDMSEEKFASYLGLPLEAIQEINNGCHDYKLSELCKIAEKLDKNLEVTLN